MRQLGLGIVFRWRQENADVPQNVDGNLRKVKATAAQTQRSFAAMGVALGATSAGIVGLAVTAGEFQRDLARVANVSSATEDQLSQLRDAAIQAGIETQFSPSEAVRGLESLASAGYNARDSMDLLNPALLLAAAGQISVGKASSTLATILKGFSLEVSDAGRITDILANAAAQAKIQIIDLELALGKTIRGASLTGQSFEEMAVGVGIAKNTMVNASSAGNSISRALTQIGVKSDFIKDKIGVNVLDAQGNFKSWLDLVVEIGDAADKKFTNAAEKTEFFNKAIGTFGLEAFQTTLNQIRATALDEGLVPAQAIDSMRRRFLDAEGTAQRFANRINNTFAGATTLLRGTIETLAVVIGEPIADVLKPAVQGLTTALNFLLKAFNSLPRPVKLAFGGIAAGIAALAGLAAAAIAVKAAFVLIGPAVAAAIPAIAGFVVAAAPIIAIVAAIGAGIALLVVGVRRNFAGLGDLWDATIGRAILLTKALVQLFRSGELSGSVLDELSRVENSGVKRFAITVYQVGFRVKRFFEGVIAGLRESLGPPLARLWSALSRVGRALERIMATFIGLYMKLGRALGFVSESGAEAVSNTPSAKFFESGAKAAEVFGTALGYVIDLFVFIVDGVAFLLEKWASALSYVISEAEAFGSFMADVWNGIVGVFEWAWTRIEEILGFSPVDEVSDKWNSLSEFFANLWTDIVEIFEAAYEKIDAIVGKVRDAAEWVVDAGETVVDWWNEDSGTESPVLQRSRQAQENLFGAVATGARILTGAPEAGVPQRSALGELAALPEQFRARFEPQTSIGGEFDAVVNQLRAIAERRSGEPMVIQLVTPSAEVLFETVQQGASVRGSRTFDVTNTPL